MLTKSAEVFAKYLIYSNICKSTPWVLKEYKTMWHNHMHPCLVRNSNGRNWYLLGIYCELGTLQGPYAHYCI